MLLVQLLINIVKINFTTPAKLFRIRDESGNDSRVIYGEPGYFG